MRSQRREGILHCLSIYALNFTILSNFQGASFRFFVLGYGLHQMGKDLFRILAFGAYTGLGLGLLMFIVACRRK